jgi:hypothetical protein
MTKTFCDRCGREGAVVPLTLSTPGRTEQQIEACPSCIAVVQAAMDRLPMEARG